MAVPWKCDKPLFVAEKSFEDKYPNLRDIRVEYEERGAFGDPGIGEPVKDEFSLRAIGPKVKCKNLECGFGYDFEPVADSLIGTMARRREGHMLCQGVGVAIGQKLERTCINGVGYVVTLLPKDK
jgi:hypothetical protein